MSSSALLPSKTGSACTFERLKFVPLGQPAGYDSFRTNSHLYNHHLLCISWEAILWSDREKCQGCCGCQAKRLWHCSVCRAYTAVESGPCPDIGVKRRSICRRICVCTWNNKIINISENILQPCHQREDWKCLLSPFFLRICLAFVPFWFQI